MGKVKNQKMQQEEEQWLAEEQEKWLNDTFRWKGIVYNDLMDIEVLRDEKLQQVHIRTVDGNTYEYDKEDIKEINGLCIKFQKDYTYTGQKIASVIPFDKIIKITYIYEG